MSLYGDYDNFYKDNPSPIVLGGRRRAATAARDDQGRFMPNDILKQINWETDPKHGVIGGKIRAKFAQRFRGRFVKAKDLSNA